MQVQDDVQGTASLMRSINQGPKDHFKTQNRRARPFGGWLHHHQSRSILSRLGVAVLVVSLAYEATAAGTPPPVRTTLVGVPRFTSQPIAISVRLENLTGDAIVLNIGFPPEFNVVITDSQGHIVKSRFLPPTSGAGSLAERGIVLTAYEKQRYAWEWDLTDDQGEAVPTGRYCLKAIFRLNGPQVDGLTSPPFCFWIVHTD